MFGPVSIFYLHLLRLLSPLRPLLGECPPCDTPPSPWPGRDPCLSLAPQYYYAQGRLAADKDRLGFRRRSSRHGFQDVFIDKPQRCLTNTLGKEYFNSISVGSSTVYRCLTTNNLS